MDTVRIVLTCPVCDGTTWIPDGDGGFRCTVCGEECYPDVMGHETEKI